MQIQDMNMELFQALQEIWEKNSERLPDDMRATEVMETLLFEDGGATTWHVVGETPAVLVVGDVRPGLSASVMLLNHEEAQVGDLIREFRDVIKTLDLKRLTAMVPSPVKNVQRALETSGFRREGHLRRSTYWNGRLVGTDIWGLYKDPPYDRKKQGKRERNGAKPHEARKKQESNGEAAKEIPEGRKDPEAVPVGTN